MFPLSLWQLLQISFVAFLANQFCSLYVFLYEKDSTPPFYYSNKYGPATGPGYPYCTHHKPKNGMV